MKTEFYSYNTGYYFSPAARFSGWMATLLSVVLILNGSVAAYLFLPIGIVTQLTYKCIAFDLMNRTYGQGAQFLGVTFGSIKPLVGLDFLFLNKNNYSQVAQSRGSMSRFRQVKFDGFVKLLDGKKLHVVQELQKSKALLQMEKIAEELGIEFRDQTEMKY